MEPEKMQNDLKVFDVRNDNIIWLNDLENDSYYSQWPEDVTIVLFINI